MSIIEHEHSQLYYEIHGEGYPIIFIHGGGGNTMAWYQQVPYFSRQYKVITVDLRGFKHSKCPPQYVHPRFFAGDVRAIMDAEGLPHAALVCQSLGAWAGLRLAVQTPQRVSCLFVNGSPTPAWSEENWRVIDRANGIFMGGDFGSSTRNTSVGWNRDIVAAHPEMTFLYSQIKSLNPPFNSRTMEDESIKVLPEDLRDYRIPTIVAGGAHDDFLNPESHFHAASLIPGATSFTFEDAGHSAYFETPEEFNAVLDAFLARHVPKSTEQP
ncbi:alpha/beta hydrolase [Caballeronia sp. INDeC2]|uniref:alpha/beta fold hydrolase n=1 Tax=Caballeronia sp. INDeC2 TaxID=2921747 RepID=UPI0020288D77|nr:alpha/beta hydrolase [Caballeronia sp. INDeC2]